MGKRYTGRIKYCENKYCTVRIVVGCNSCCVYIAVMWCSTVRNVRLVQYSVLLANWLWELHLVLCQFH